MKSTPPALPAVVAPPRPTGIVAARALREAADRATAPAPHRLSSSRLGEAGSPARPVASARAGRAGRAGPLGAYVDTYA